MRSHAILSITRRPKPPTRQVLTKHTDDGAGITIWVRAELNAGLVAAAIPPLKSLFENILRNVFGVRSQLRSNTNGYGPKTGNTRRSCVHDLEDDEIAMRSHAAHLHSGNEFQLHPHSERNSIDGGSSGFEDQQRKTDSEDQGQYGGQHHGPITKTISYTIRHDKGV
jgi:hypothetical protein